MKVHIETPRLLLREWSEADLEPFSCLNADPGVMEFFLNPLPPEQSREFYGQIQAKFAACGFGAYAVERKAEGGGFIGFVGLHRIGFEADFTPGIEIAWRLLPGAWGRGYAPEAAACLDYAGNVLGRETVYSFTSLPNVRSQRVMQKIGMKRIGEFDHPLLPPGHPLLRHVLYAKRLARHKDGPASSHFNRRFNYQAIRSIARPAGVTRTPPAQGD